MRKAPVSKSHATSEAVQSPSAGPRGRPPVAWEAETRCRICLSEVNPHEHAPPIAKRATRRDVSYVCPEHLVCRECAVLYVEYAARGNYELKCPAPYCDHVQRNPNFEDLGVSPDVVRLFRRSAEGEEPKDRVALKLCPECRLPLRANASNHTKLECDGCAATYCLVCRALMFYLISCAHPTLTLATTQTKSTRNEDEFGCCERRRTFVKGSSIANCAGTHRLRGVSRVSSGSTATSSTVPTAICLLSESADATRCSAPSAAINSVSGVFVIIRAASRASIAA